MLDKPDEIETLKETIRQLRTLLHGEWLPPGEWCVSKLECRALSALLENEFVTTERMYDALYLGEKEHADWRNSTHVIVRFLNVRLNMQGFDNCVRTQMGRGYYITKEERLRLRELCGIY